MPGQGQPPADCTSLPHTNVPANPPIPRQGSPDSGRNAREKIRSCKHLMPEKQRPKGASTAQITLGSSCPSVPPARVCPGLPPAGTAAGGGREGSAPARGARVHVGSAPASAHESSPVQTRPVKQLRTSANSHSAGDVGGCCPPRTPTPLPPSPRTRPCWARATPVSAVPGALWTPVPGTHCPARASCACLAPSHCAPPPVGRTWGEFQGKGQPQAWAGPGLEGQGAGHRLDQSRAWEKGPSHPVWGALGSV